MKRTILILAIIMLYAPLVLGLPGVKQYQATWTANTETDLNGYYLYWRTVGGQFSNANRIQVVKTATTLVLSGSVPYGTQIALTAFDTSDNEGGYSNIVPFDRDGLAPGVPGGLAIQPVP